MAVSRLWPVTVRLAAVLDYAANPEKTTKAKSKYSNADYQALRDVVNYVKDGKKTEQELFCQGINCNPSTAVSSSSPSRSSSTSRMAFKPTTATSASRKPTSRRSWRSISGWSLPIPFGANGIRCLSRPT